MTYNHEELIALLRSPGDLQPLKRLSDKEFQSPPGEKFPVIDGVICLLNEEERGKDLGDSKFYEEPDREENDDDANPEYPALADLFLEIGPPVRRFGFPASNELFYGFRFRGRRVLRSRFGFGRERLGGRLV